MNTTAPLSKFWAYVAVLVGAFLLLTGVAAVFGYLGLAAFFTDEDWLGMWIGPVAAASLGLVGGGLAVIHGLRSILGRSSRPLRMPPIYFFWISFALVLGVGNVLLSFHVAERFLFPILFLFGAALPAIGVLAWSVRRLGAPLTWRQGALALVAGSTLSILVAVVLEGILPYLAYLLVEPLEFLATSFGATFSGGAGGLLERLFFSPLVLVFLISTAIEAPIPEEFAKALALPLFGANRITSERQAFALGLASGAGFAVLENMLYEGIYAQYGGWSWGGITLLRGIGAVLHPLCAGLVAVGWFRMRSQGVSTLLRAFVPAVGLHTLWNGGFTALLYLTGLDVFSGQGPSLDLYGTAVEVLLVAYLIVLSLGLWWILRSFVRGLAEGVAPDPGTVLVTRRALAGWALAAVLVVIPIRAALTGAWQGILSLAVGGR